MMNKDEIVANLQEIVKTKRAEIALIEKPQFKTNMSLNLGFGPVNLTVCNDVRQLLKYLSILYVEANAFIDVAKSCNIDMDFSHQGFSFSEWQHDIQARISKINVSKKKSELAEIEKRLEALESKELKEQRELEALQKLLNG